MPTDRTHDIPPQGDNPPQNLTERLFGPHIGQAWVAESGRWDGCFYSASVVAAFSPNTRHHVSCALMKPGSTSRDKANFDGAILFVLDDVGVVAAPGTLSISNSRVDRSILKMFAPSGYYAVETSPGNFQVGWRIEVEKDLARWEHFVRSMGQHPVYGRGVHDVVHYFRTETGSGKPEKGAFKTRLAEPWDGTIWKLDELAEHFGIDMSPEAVAATNRPLAASSGVKAVGMISQALGREIIQRLPNRDKDDWFNDRTSWVGIAHALRSAVGEDEGRELWLEWNSMRRQKPGEPERVWDTLPADSTNDLDTLRWWLIHIHTETSKIFTEIKGKIADEQAPLTALDDTEVEAIPMPERKGDTEKAKAEKAFDELLKEARRLVKIPDAFKATATDDAHWLAKDGGFVDAFDTAATVQAGSPTVFAPFDRGVVSARTGAPFSGKSLLMLNQMAAFCAGRADLIGTGGQIMFGGDVLYFCNEDSREAAVRRLQAWKKRHGVTSAKHKLIIVRSELLSRNGENAVIECFKVLETAVEHLRAGGSLPMIVIDTLSASVTGVDENSVREMGEAISMLKRIAWAFWAAVVFIHHGTKVAWKDNGGEEQGLASLLRGTGSLAGALRGADATRVLDAKQKIALGWAGRKVVGCRTVKASDDDMAGERYYEIETVQIDVVHPETGVLVSKGMPVMVPAVPSAVVAGGAVFTDLDDLADKERRLVAAMGEGPVWVLSKAQRVAPSHGKNLHEVWGCDIKTTRQIVDVWVGEGRYELREKRVGNSYRDEISGSVL